MKQIAALLVNTSDFENNPLFKYKLVEGILTLGNKIFHRVEFNTQNNCLWAFPFPEGRDWKGFCLGLKAQSNQTLFREHSTTDKPNSKGL